MPRIFDNIHDHLLPTLQATLKTAQHGDFCVGYFNLRGWKYLADYVDAWAGGAEQCCRLLVGMHIHPTAELRQALGSQNNAPLLDNQSAIREKYRIAEEFRSQLTVGIPTNADEAVLRQLATQIRTNKLQIKVYLRHALHAKLYLLYRQDTNNPVTGFLGSSNLTMAGLNHQGELNVDVLEHDACNKLVAWFETRWKDRWCLDISQALAAIIDKSWAGERLVPPYHVYLKIAYHLSQEARAGLSEFRIPQIFGQTLFDFQIAAVQIAAHHLNKRGGVLIGDVVGLGKSIIATALAKIFEDDYHTDTLIICPKNLVTMWEDYVHRYRLLAKVISLSTVISELPEKTRRYRVVLIDESHNLRNREGKRWKVIHEYIQRNESLCILLSATPYNKTYLDLTAQLGLFLPPDRDLGMRPEKLLSALGGEPEFMRRHQCSVRSLAAFEKSTHPDDWRDLMRLYMVRRTRGFIMQHYAHEDKDGRYLHFADGRKSYFPQRIPKNIHFNINTKDSNDPYARFYSEQVVETINALALPRYGLGNYLLPMPETVPTLQQQKLIDGLSRSGTRLMGFCRTNLFKRLESAGPAFLLSIERHILRNFIVLHALDNGLELPLGTQEAQLLDTRLHDEDPDATNVTVTDEPDDNAEPIDTDPSLAIHNLHKQYTATEVRAQAAVIYASYVDKFKKRFKWLPSSLFTPDLAEHLLTDAQSLLKVLGSCGEWQPDRDTKLAELIKLITKQHATDKILIFTQFADTARYLVTQLQARNIPQVEAATGHSSDPTAIAWRFAPLANNKKAVIGDDKILRVLIATDVLSEGQNLQDCAIIVNYDLPWAIIRLIQRAGRVDRIGQQSKQILCYSFVPADGVERLINLRAKVQQRLIDNAEVVGSDEVFFDDDNNSDQIRDLYTEQNGILDDNDDIEVDLASYAYQIWKNATDADPQLQATIEAMPNVVYATKTHQCTPIAPNGVLVYMRTSQDNDALAWIDAVTEQAITQSQFTILKAAACNANTEAQPRLEQHHNLTRAGLAHIVTEEQSFGGALGRPSGVRFKTYERLKRYVLDLNTSRNSNLFATADYLYRLGQAQEEIYRYPLYQSATDSLHRQLKASVSDQQLADLVLSMREDKRLCIIDIQQQQQEPKLVCSMGLVM